MQLVAARGSVPDPKPSLLANLKKRPSVRGHKLFPEEGRPWGGEIPAGGRPVAGGPLSFRSMDDQYQRFATMPDNSRPAVADVLSGNDSMTPLEPDIVPA